MISDNWITVTPCVVNQTTVRGGEWCVDKLGEFDTLRQARVFASSVANGNPTTHIKNECLGKTWVFKKGFWVDG